MNVQNTLMLIILKQKYLHMTGKIIGISVLDHIIIARKGFVSMKEEGYL